MKPRTGNYLGMQIHHSFGTDGTWLEGEEFCYPKGGMTRYAYAKCEDGELRKVRCGIADTAFSIPGSVRIEGKTIRGYVSSDETGFKFTGYKNAQQS